MITEPIASEIFVLWTVNTVCSMVCSQIHKSLYFLLAINYWAMHFGHYILTFIVLWGISCAGSFQRQSIPKRNLALLVLTEALISTSACIVHMEGSDGTVYTIRVTDFAVTLIIMYTSRYVISSDFFSFKSSNNLFLLVSTNFLFYKFFIKLNL